MVWVLIWVRLVARAENDLVDELLKNMCVQLLRHMRLMKAHDVRTCGRWESSYLVCSGFLAGPFFMDFVSLLVILFQLSAFDPVIFCRSKESYESWSATELRVS